MPLTIAELIKKKRDGGTLADGDIRRVIDGYTAGDIPDYQMAALLMAIFFNGLKTGELSTLTDAMIHSGEVLDHSSVPGRKVDKHSTGGVGDKISICLAPAVAALGVPVPMISGRGLGHTGGTLDKLEAIEGFNVNLPLADARQMLLDLNLFLIGQTKSIAPADRRLYALRDVTGTVESIPLIASSIMSKKLAEGIDALVLDVKFGRGAFMKTSERATELAEILVGIGQEAGIEVTALLTDMNRPIGRTVGNALETREAIEVLRGNGPLDTVDLTVELGAEMLLLGNRATTLADGRKQMHTALKDGSALRRFARCIERQGGDPRVTEDPNRLPRANCQVEIKARKTGFLSDILPMETAMAALHLGAGRYKKEDAVDPACGVEFLVDQGDQITTNQTVALLHHNGRGAAEATALTESAIVIDDAPPPKRSRIAKRISGHPED